MEYALSIILFIFAGAILLYAGLMALTKDYSLLPFRSRVSVKPKDKKAYTFELSKAVALTATAPAIGGAVALWNPVAGLIAMLAAFIAAIWLGTKITKKLLQ